MWCSLTSLTQFIDYHLEKSIQDKSTL